MASIPHAHHCFSLDAAPIRPTMRTVLDQVVVEKSWGTLSRCPCFTTRSRPSSAMSVRHVSVGKREGSSTTGDQRSKSAAMSASPSSPIDTGASTIPPSCSTMRNRAPRARSCQDTNTSLLALPHKLVRTRQVAFDRALLRFGSAPQSLVASPRRFRSTERCCRAMTTSPRHLPKLVPNQEDRRVQSPSHICHAS